MSTGVLTSVSKDIENVLDDIGWTSDKWAALKKGEMSEGDGDGGKKLTVSIRADSGMNEAEILERGNLSPLK
jgi:hypothetical protein